MKSYRLVNLLFTLVIMLFMMTACETELPEECQDISIVAEANSDSTHYTLIADLRGLDDIEFSWFINDQQIATGDSIGTTLDFNFAPGVYSVCITAESITCGAFDFCTEIVVRDTSDQRDDCPKPSFSAERMHRNKYLFVADFEGMDSLEYVWYVDGDSIESEPLSEERHHKFDYEFRPGTHTVCIKARTEECGELAFCKEMVIGESECPELSFYKEAAGDSAYFFIADFRDADSIQYVWSVNDSIVDKENVEGYETDHKFYWEFTPGTYDICIESIATDQCESTKYCYSLEIDEETSCPDLYYYYEEGNDGAYYFTADFDGMEDLEWYAWKVDGQIKDEESGENKDNEFTYYFDGAGDHEVCLVTETPECPQATYFCKTINTDPATNCVDLSYSAEEESNGYIFSATFDDRDSITYIWKVYIGDDYQGGEVREFGSDADHDFFWEFTPGVDYTVCLKQDGCDSNAVCETYSID